MLGPPSQIALRAGGFSALIVVGMTVLGISILYSAAFVYFDVRGPNSMYMEDGKPLLSNSVLAYFCLLFRFGMTVPKYLSSTSTSKASTPCTWKAVSQSPMVRFW